MLTKKKKVALYDVYIGVHDDYLYLEVFPDADIRGHALKIPMTKLYKDEIDYVLRIENWDSIDLEGFTDKQNIADFIKPEMPKLIAWWTHFLPKPKAK